MQTSRQISLNAVRVFAVVVEMGSFKRAAAQLGVTPGAVSRQVATLEAALGRQLFDRRNNAIRLTDTGDAFFCQAQSGLQTIYRSIEATIADTQELTVQVPTTLAIRFLIPQLNGFKQKWPDIAVRIETQDKGRLTHGSGADIVIDYSPVSEPIRNAEILAEDRCRPYLAPSLLSQMQDPVEFTGVPALQCTQDNWDWKAWLEATQGSNVPLQYVGYFDLDDAALRAAISGMGMVLASTLIVRDDLAAGNLCPLPHTSDILLGYYTLHRPKQPKREADVFIRWLKTAL